MKYGPETINQSRAAHIKLNFKQNEGEKIEGFIILELDSKSTS